MAVDGTGTTVTFGTSAFAALLLSVDGPSISRASIDSSHMGTTNDMTFIPATLSDNGELSMTFEHLTTALPPIVGAAVETFTVDYAGLGSGNTWAASGFMTAYSASSVIGDRMTATGTVKLSGAITVA